MNEDKHQTFIRRLFTTIEFPSITRLPYPRHINMAQISTFLMVFLIYWTTSFARNSISSRQPTLQQQPLISYSSINIRPASKHDLDDITTVVIDAFSPGRMYHYVFPELSHYKEYHWRCLREAVGEAFANLTVSNFINVITVPVSGSNIESNINRHERVVSIAFWAVVEPGDDDIIIQSRGDSFLRDGSCSDHLDMNITRAEDFMRQTDAYEKHFILNYPHKQVYLGLLATHPDWDGHGYGAAQCEWGLDMAANLGVVTTLMAISEGWPLYDELEFESVANLSIKTLDDLEDIWFEYMRHGT